MGVTVEQSSDTNISGSIKPPHPSHMHHPYWLQHRFTAHDDTTLSEVYSNLVASSMRQMMAWTPLGWLGGAARHVPTLDETVHMSAELLMHSTEFTARRAGLAYGQYRVLALEDVEDLPPHCAGMRIAFQSIAAMARFHQALSRLSNSRIEDSANTVFENAPVEPVTIRDDVEISAPPRRPYETNLTSGELAQIVPTKPRKPKSANEAQFHPKAKVLAFKVGG